MKRTIIIGSIFILLSVGAAAGFFYWKNLRGAGPAFAPPPQDIVDLFADQPTVVGNQIDFVLRRGNGRLDAIECKVSPDRFNVESLRQFRSIYRKGANFAICPMVTEPFTRHFGKIKVHFTSTFHFLSAKHNVR